VEDGLIEAEGSKATNNVESERVVVEDFVFIVVLFIVEGWDWGVMQGLGRLGGGVASVVQPIVTGNRLLGAIIPPAALYSRPRGGLSAALQLKTPCDCVWFWQGKKERWSRGVREGQF